MNGRTITGEITCLTWNPYVPHRVNENPHCCCKISVIIALESSLRSFRFFDPQLSHVLLISPLRAVCLAHPSCWYRPNNIWWRAQLWGSLWHTFQRISCNFLPPLNDVLHRTGQGHLHVFRVWVVTAFWWGGREQFYCSRRIRFFNTVERIVAVAFLTFLLLLRWSHIRIFFWKSAVLAGFEAFLQYLLINAEIILQIRPSLFIRNVRINSGKRLFTSSCLSVCISSVPTGRFFIKFRVGEFHENVSRYSGFG